MGFVGDLFNSSRGTGWNPTATTIDQPVTSQNAIDQRNQAQNAIAQQQAFANAAGGSNGLQNQQNVFNQLQGVASGQGPNPAQAMLNQSTGQNVANQAALMASQRGVNANPGLVARQAAQQGAGIQQNAAGQAATMQANQSLGALNQLGGIAGQQVGQQANALSNLNNLQQNMYGQDLGAIAQRNATAVSQQNGMNQASGALAAQNAQNQSNIFGGLVGGIAKGAMMLADGGEVKPIAATPVADVAGAGPQSKTAKILSEPTAPVAGGSADSAGFKGGHGAGEALVKGLQSGFNAIGNLFAGAPAAGGTGASALVTPPGGGAMGPGMTMAPMYRGGNVGSKLKLGGKVPGQAKVKGDSYANDTVEAKLSPGEIVIPRSVMQSKDPVKGAAAFVASVMAKSKKSKK